MERRSEREIAAIGRVPGRGGPLRCVRTVVLVDERPFAIGIVVIYEAPFEFVVVLAASEILREAREQHILLMQRQWQGAGLKAFHVESGVMECDLARLGSQSALPVALVPSQA